MRRAKGTSESGSRPMIGAKSPGRPRRKLRPGWLSAEDIAELLPYGARWVRRHLGSLALRLNRRDYRWRQEDVHAWLADRGYQRPSREPLE